MVSRVTAKGIWLSPRSFYVLSGVGPIGSVFLLLTAMSLALSLTTPNPLRNALASVFVGGWIVAGFAIRDRHKRHVYARLISRVKWFIHRKTGRALFEGSWMSTRPVTKSNLPGLLTWASIGEQDTPRGPIALVHHPVADVTSMVFESRPNGTEFTADQIDGFIPGWEQWVRNNLNEPAVEGLMVTTVTSAIPKAALDLQAAEFVDGDDPASDVFNEITTEMAGRPSSRLFITVNLGSVGGESSHLSWTAERVGPHVEQICSTLVDAGAGEVVPVSQGELARVWRAQFAPSASVALAEHPDTVIHTDRVGPATAVERPWGWLHEGYCTVGVTMSGQPSGLLTPAVYENAAKGLTGVDVVRTVTTYRPLSALTKTMYFKGFGQTKSWRSSMTGDGELKAKDSAVLSDADETEQDLARGADLVKVGFAASATIVEPEGKGAATTAAARLVGMCGPLGTTMRVMDRAHQTTFVATLPGGFPVPGAFTPLEDIE